MRVVQGKCLDRVMLLVTEQYMSRLTLTYPASGLEDPTHRESLAPFLRAYGKDATEAPQAFRRDCQAGQRSPDRSKDSGCFDIPASIQARHCLHQAHAREISPNIRLGPSRLSASDLPVPCGPTHRARHDRYTLGPFGFKSRVAKGISYFRPSCMLRWYQVSTLIPYSFGNDAAVGDFNCLRISNWVPIEIVSVAGSKSHDREVPSLASGVLGLDVKNLG